MATQKITFVIKSLQVGGVEKALVTLANHAAKKCDVKIILFDNKKKDLVNELNSNVKVKEVNVLQRLYMKADTEDKKTIGIGLLLLKAFIRGIQKLHLEGFVEKLIFMNYEKEDCNIIVSYTGYPGPWDALVKACTADKKVIYIHSDPNMLGIHKLDTEQYYRDFHEIICISKNIKQLLLKINPTLESKTRVVYNLLDKEKITRLASQKSPYSDDRKVIVTVARVDNLSKRFDRIVACSQHMLKNGFSDFCWHIIGDGPDYGKLKQMIQECSLEAYIYLDGMQKNPYPYIKNADIFVLASDYEGYPVTIMETLYLQTPPVVTDFSSAREVINDMVNGLVVEKDAVALAKGIIRVLSDNQLYHKLKKELESQNK